MGRASKRKQKKRKIQTVNLEHSSNIESPVKEKSFASRRRILRLILVLVIVLALSFCGFSIFQNRSYNQQKRNLLATFTELRSLYETNKQSFELANNESERQTFVRLKYLLGKELKNKFLADDDSSLNIWRDFHSAVSEVLTYDVYTIDSTSNKLSDDTANFPQRFLLQGTWAGFPRFIDIIARRRFPS